MTFAEYLKTLKEKTVTVIGAGISNKPLINALRAEGINFTVRDQRDGDDYLKDLTEEVIFRTPGLMPSNEALVEAVSHGAILTSEMEVFLDVCPCKIIGITGSDGKTTTATIIAELLKNEGLTVHLGGNIGNPLLCSADDMKKSDIVVVELSSFQLISMKKSPQIAVVTNLAPNHLDVHKDMPEYIAAKKNIFAHQQENDRAVFNLDNEYTRKYAGQAVVDDILMFSRVKKVRNGVFVEDGHIFEAINGKAEVIMPVEDISLLGQHNVENFMAAFAATRGLVSIAAMSKTARTIKGVPHRIEFVRELRGVRYYNDSIASSPSRAIAGLRAFDDIMIYDKKIVLIAGGKDKALSYDALASVILRYVKVLILIGETADIIRKAVENTPEYSSLSKAKKASMIKIIMCDSLEQAVTSSAKEAVPDDIVLLAPACASFDMFSNFEERGKKFKKFVKQLV